MSKEEKKEEVDFSELDQMEKNLIDMSDDELHHLLDTVWYPRANNALVNQRRIWDYSYLAYKGIMLWSEMNRKRRANGYGLYVNIPRTFATIEGIRKNFNINNLEIDIEKQGKAVQEKLYKIRSFLNYDLDRSHTRDQIKDAGFNKLVYGNGFMYTFLMDRKGKYYNIAGNVDEKTGRVKSVLDKEEKHKYYGMVARSINPYHVLPDPDGVTLDVDNNVRRLCNFHCIRTVKHIANFRRDWRGIVPDSILEEVKPGGRDMTNYEIVKETIDYMFNEDALNYDSTVSVNEYIRNSNIKSEYSAADRMVEERLWIGEDFLILQAGAGAKICLVSPNPNPDKRLNLLKLDNTSVPGEYWSMGEPYIMRYQQIEENRVHNSLLDLIHFSISGMVGINTNYLEDPTDTEIYPEKVWKFKAIPGTKISDVLQNFQPSSNAIAPAIAFLREVKGIGQQTTSITDFVTGASESIAETATETNRLSNASDLTIVDKIRDMVKDALIPICENWFSMYPVVYAKEKIKLAYNDKTLYFFGNKKKDVSEKDLTDVLKEYEPEDIIFLDDLDVAQPKFKIVGDIEISKDVKLSQWVKAIDFANKINEQAFNQGDPRRIDTIKMGQDAMQNFDVISDPTVYLMDGRPVKADEIITNAMANKQQNQNGGRPAENNIEPLKTGKSAIMSKSQPTKK